MINTNLNEDFVRPVIGLEDGGDVIAECRSCQKPLFKVVQVSQNSPKIKWRNTIIEIVEQVYLSNCPYCKSKSWKLKACGELLCCGIDGETIVSSVEPDDPFDNNGKITYELEVEKL